MKGIRSFLVLVVIAAALGGYLYYDSKHEPGDEKKQEKVYPGVVADKIERVTVKSAAGCVICQPPPACFWMVVLSPVTDFTVT